MALVYILTCTANGKSYVGMTTGTLETRWACHCRDARYSDKGMLVLRAIRKHGPETWTREVIKDDLTEDEAYALEIVEIKKRGTLHPGGYNVCAGGKGGQQGRKFSAEVREKLRQKKLGKKNSEEHRRKTIEALKRRVVLDETRQKHSERMIGNEIWKLSVDKVVQANARHYLITHEDGRQEKIFNLSEFCRQNGIVRTTLRSAVQLGRTHKGMSFALIDD